MDTSNNQKYHEYDRESSLNKIDQALSRLYKAVYKLPDGTDIKKLKGVELYRLRVGDYRIIYRIEEEIKIITIENIDNRGDVYKRL